MAERVGRAEFLLRTVRERLRDRLKALARLFMDDTVAADARPGTCAEQDRPARAYVRGDRA